ncbi:MAG: RibD family protein [Alphaproteobacteria bacterium]|nr:RibD family protein [Alphaproteobacteria bacterium]
MNARPNNRPQVTLKIATSLDGRIATASGESRWITGEAARAAVHRLRAGHDGVMIGAETAAVDDPELTVRLDETPVKPPLRIVLDSRLRVSPSSRLMKTLAIAPLLIIGARDADRSLAVALQKAGAQVDFVPRGLDGLELDEVFALLKETHAVDRLLIEGGGRIAASCLAAGCIDRIEWFRAPMLLGAEGRPGIGPLALKKLTDAPRFARVAIREVGPDLWESYERIS